MKHIYPLPDVVDEDGDPVTVSILESSSISFAELSDETAIIFNIDNSVDP